MEVLNTPVMRLTSTFASTTSVTQVIHVITLTIVKIVFSVVVVVLLIHVIVVLVLATCVTVRVRTFLFRQVLRIVLYSDVLESDLLPSLSLGCWEVSDEPVHTFKRKNTNLFVSVEG